MIRRIITICLFTTFLVLPGQIFAQEQLEIVTFYLTRHAEKASDGTKDPPLNEIGKKRAERLANMLKEIEFAGIYSTAYKRTKQTAMPIANQQHAEIIEYKPFGNEIFKRLVAQNKGGNYFVSGHSNTIPALVNALIGEEKYQQLDEQQYDKLFVVSMVSGVMSKVQVLNY